jgi:THO complex subunit 2
MTEKSTKTDILIKKILSLIGFFDLDPNRVLDIVLTAYENDYRNLNYLQIIKIFPQHSFQHILGFKFQNQFSTEMNTELSTIFSDACPNGDINNYRLFLVTAQLIKHGFLNLEDILPHLSSDEKIEEFYLDKINLSVSIYKYYTQMRLNKDVVITEVKAKEKEKEDLNELKKQDMKNQKFILLSALIRVNSFHHCEILYNLYSNFYDPLAHPYLTKALCEISHWIIEPAFRYISFSKLFNNYQSNDSEENDFSCNTSYGLNQINDPKTIITELNKLFKLLSVGLSADVVLFTKICRLIKYYSKTLLAEEANVEILSEMIMKVFLPSLSLIEDCPPGLVNDLWLLLNEFDYCKRYYFYNYWMNFAYRIHPRLYVQHSIVTKETNKWLKTLEKETYRQNGRKLGVLTNSNPCIVFDIAIRIVLSYDNQIPIFISTLSYCSNLSYDVISFVLLKLLSDPSREKLDLNNADISYFLINIANFVGLFYKKQHLVEFSGLIYFLANKLRNNSTIELLVFKELISKMSGWPTLEDLNENQLNSFAGGVNLIYEAMNISSEIKNLKKSNQSLLNFFFKVSNITQKNHLSSEHSLTNGNLSNY